MSNILASIYGGALFGQSAQYQQINEIYIEREPENLAKIIQIACTIAVTMSQLMLFCQHARKQNDHLATFFHIREEH